MGQSVPPLIFAPAGVFIALACGTGEGGKPRCTPSRGSEHALVAPTPNLAPNGSLETPGDDADSPEGWTRLQWGTHDARFSYAEQGRTGSRSVAVQIGSYTSGDARWSFAPVPVEGGEPYVYLDYYRSDVSTKLVALYTAEDGTSRYETLRMVPPSETWAAAGVALTPPPDATSVAIEHVLAGVGKLEIDDVRFALPQPSDLETGVPNGALEQRDDIDPTQPLAWSSSSWGTHDTRLQYDDTGRSGRGISVRMSSHTDGNAAWYFAPRAVTSGAQHMYGDWYKADVESFLTARWTLPDGSYRYERLGRAPAAAEYTELRQELTTPEDARELTVLHGLEQVGTLQIDDVSLRAHGSESFERALVSITFDDGWRSDYAVALPLLKRHRLVATHYVITGLLGRSNRLSWKMLQELFERGDEIAAHTRRHPDLVQVADDMLDDELGTAPAALQEHCLGDADNFSSPFGSYDDRTLAAIRARYRSHRTTDIGFNTKIGFDRYRLKVQSMRATTTVADIDAWADEAAASKSWLILVYHDVVSPEASSFSVSPAALERQLEALAKHDLPVVTVQQALDELLPQLE